MIQTERKTSSELCNTRVEHERKRIELMVDCLGKVKVFGDDSADEFKVVMEDGSFMGIFKTWAVPVIPFIEANRLDLLRTAVKGNDFWSSMPVEGRLILEDWMQKMQASPLRFWESLELARSEAMWREKRLLQVFEEIPLPNDETERFVELVSRLKIAFGESATFYHLEAMVGDKNASLFNPVFTDSETTEGGVLDLVGLALPAALKRIVGSKKLDWGDQSWESLEQTVAGGLSDSERAVILRISNWCGVKPEEVLFAANALEFIPVSVGGKVDDFDQIEAASLILNKLPDVKKAVGVDTVARDINALIRFMNWFPLTRKSNNWAGEAWRYAAVCDTSSTLVDLVKNASVWSGEKDRVFREVVAPQIGTVDATSAKGRLVLSLIEMGWLDEKTEKMIETRTRELAGEVAEKLVAMQSEDAVMNLGDSRDRALVGGKAAGLVDAMELFGENTVPKGVVVTAEFTHKWILGIPGVFELVSRMESSNSHDEVVFCGQQIQELIQAEDFPISFSEITEDGKLVVRSSSFDEDTWFNGTAAGIYESFAVEGGLVNEAVKGVLASFFGDKAVSYRQLHGLSHRPQMGVIIQELVEGIAGGVIFSDNGDWEMVVSDSAAKVVGNGSGGFDSVKCESGVVKEHLVKGLLDLETSKWLGKLVVEASRLMGSNLDVEFAITNEGWKCLQVRPIKSAKIKNTSEVGFDSVVEVTLERLDDFNSLEGIDGQVRLRINQDIELDQFQGGLFRFMARHRDTIREIILERRIPRTSHFANICLNLGIKLTFDETNN